MKFRLKIYLASFLQIPQIKFVNNDQPVVWKQGSLEHADFVSLLQLHEFESFQSVACEIGSSQCSLLDLGKRLNCELKSCFEDKGSDLSCSLVQGCSVRGIRPTKMILISNGLN